MIDEKMRRGDIQKCCGTRGRNWHKIGKISENRKMLIYAMQWSVSCR